MASEVPSMYGIVAAVVTLGSVNEKLDHAKIGSGGCKHKANKAPQPQHQPPTTTANKQTNDSLYAKQLE